MLDLDNLPQKGKVVTYKHRGAEFQMTIVEARIRYGKIDVALQPVNGNGAFWVRFDKLNDSTDTVGEQLKELAGINA